MLHANQNKDIQLRDQKAAFDKQIESDRQNLKQEVPLTNQPC